MATQSNFETIQFNQLGDEFLFTTKLNPESAVIKHNFETGEILKSFAVGNAKGGKDIFSIVKELLQGASYDEYEQRFSVSACYSTNYAKIYAVILTFEYLSEEDGTGHYSMEQGEPSLRLTILELNWDNSDSKKLPCRHGQSLHHQETSLLWPTAVRFTSLIPRQQKS